jgi:hypothetical protein
MAKLSPQDLAGYALAAGFPPAEIATAVAVALGESGGETTATNRNTNGSYDYGLWQINTVHGPLLSQGDRFNPLDNAKMAFTVWQRAGNKWTPWSVYKSGVYRTFLPQATLGAAKPTNVTANPPVVTGSAPAVDDPNSGPVDSVANSLSGIATAIGEFGKTLTSINTFVTNLFSGGTWLRIGAFIMGCVLLLFSFVRLTGTDKAVVSLGKTAIAARTGVKV